METRKSEPLLRRIRTLVIGGARSPFDHKVFHHLSLIAFFAWVGLGADGLSSSCYGPPEAFRALQASGHGFPHLLIFVAIGSAITVLVISTSYSQIIELFPSGGGGYLVASKLLSPELGMVSGCALLLDYVLTISISIAAGVEAFLSYMPEQWHGLSPHHFKLAFAVVALLVLTLMNLRGVKESVVPLVPIFIIFVLTHAFVIVWTIASRMHDFQGVAQRTVGDVSNASSTLGWLGMTFLVLKAYSMGAGTYTGIEAVSNGLPILREPHVVTGKRTMRYMAISLSIAVLGLMLAYLLTNIASSPQIADHKKTVNGVLFEVFTQGWSWHWGPIFVWVTLISEAAILFVAAQTGFLDGPRVLSSMALDSWFPHRFATLSDRLVTQNGILLMGTAALVTMVLSNANVDFLVVLYSINVFITFCLSQTGMVRHWWIERGREPDWKKKLSINGIGLALCLFILVSTVTLKFTSGGWVTILLTGSLVIIVLLIRRHYTHTRKLLGRLNALVRVAEALPPKAAVPPPDGNGGTLPAEATAGAAALAPAVEPEAGPAIRFDPNAKTAVLLVNGFNGLGLHTLFSIVRLFGGVFRNFVIVQVGVIDVGNFKGVSEMGRLREHVQSEVQRYVDFLHKEGYYVEAFTSVGIDVVDEIAKLAPQILERFPNAVFFGGQLVFPNETVFTRWLHNNTVFSLQRRFYNQGVPVVILPIRV